MPAAVERRLLELSRLIPVALITSKGLDFVHRRTKKFASAWASSAGIETTLADGSTHVSEGVPDMTATLIEIRRIVPERVQIEEKRSSDGRLLGICVDWTRAADAVDERLVGRLAALLRRRGAYVDRPSRCTYMDAFAAPPDKGLALERLKDLLRIKGAVMYMGDSALDNAAFAKSDIAVGVDHGQPTSKLQCSYLIGYDSVGRFLSLLMERDLEFSGGVVRALESMEEPC